jgi:hypothetical protein
MKSNNGVMAVGVNKMRHPMRTGVAKKNPFMMVLGLINNQKVIHVARHTFV